MRNLPIFLVCIYTFFPMYNITEFASMKIQDIEYILKDFQEFCDEKGIYITFQCTAYYDNYQQKG